MLGAISRGALPDKAQDTPNKIAEHVLLVYNPSA
jgi:hypothetical protein